MHPEVKAAFKAFFSVFAYFALPVGTLALASYFQSWTVLLLGLVLWGAIEVSLGRQARRRSDRAISKPTQIAAAIGLIILLIVLNRLLYAP
jgi:hypothetical protein